MQEILQELKRTFPAEMHPYIFNVGGMVRDFLKAEHSGAANPFRDTISGGIKPGIDVDLVAQVSSEDLLRIGCRYVDAKSAAPVFLLKHEQLGDIQIAHPRQEVKVGTGSNGFVFQTFGDFPGGTWLPIEEDLVRRDFTVNAMAMTLDGKIIDPFNGLTHLMLNELHHVSDAFSEDAARVFRAYMLCARGFNLADSTREYIRALDLTAEFAKLPTDRVFKEMEKAMKAPYPVRFFRELVRTGQGAHFFPEVLQMIGIPAGPVKFHGGKDVFEHSCAVLEKVSEMTNNPVARCAAFFHDLGKLTTPEEELPRHFSHDARGEEMARAMMYRLHAPGTYIQATSRINKLHMKGSVFNSMRDGSKVEFAKEALPVAEILPFIVRADAGVEMERFEDCTRIAAMSATQLGITREKMREMRPDTIADLIINKKVDLFRSTRPAATV